MQVINVTFFPEERLEVVSGLDFLLMSEENAVGIGQEWMGFAVCGILSR